MSRLSFLFLYVRTVCILYVVSIYSVPYIQTHSTFRRQMTKLWWLIRQSLAHFFISFHCISSYCIRQPICINSQGYSTLCLWNPFNITNHSTHLSCRTKKCIEQPNKDNNISTLLIFAIEFINNENYKTKQKPNRNNIIQI